MMRALLTGAFLCLVACSSDKLIGDYPDSSCDLAEPATDTQSSLISVATFWTADDREYAALKRLLDSVDRDRYVVETQQMRTRVDAQRHINDAFENAQLPDVFQVNGGSDVLRWVRDRPADATDVCALDRLRDSYGWQGSYFEAALRPLTCHQHLYGLPVGIHNLNVLFYNRELFARLQEVAKARGLKLIEPAQLGSVAAFVEELALVNELGVDGDGGEPVVPLAVGAQSDWPLTIIAFENVLLGLGNDAYTTLWMGGLEGDTGAGRRALETSLQDMVSVLRQLRSYSNAEARVSWQDALRQVGSGDALFTITGDWGWAQLDEGAEGRVATVTFPGTAGTFVYTPDSFAVPRELGKTGFAAHSFLHDVVEDEATLLAFSNTKHSIPPRVQLSPTQLDELKPSVRETYERFQGCAADTSGCQLLLAVSGLGPPPGTNPCFDDIDALLTLAVTGVSPSAEQLETRLCTEPFPKGESAATARMIELLLSIGNQGFATDCR
jgi:ABC-type glycerol-3-phosphate transport system substrate-binding protein